MSTQPPSGELIREIVISAHGDFDKVKSMLAEHPELLDVTYAWSETDLETPIMAAAHMGNRPIAELLLDRGAPLAICTAAMLGDNSSVVDWLAKDAILIHAHGAHKIPLLGHAAFSGKVELTEMLVSRGAHEGESLALFNAVNLGYKPLARWLLENAQPDLSWKNWDERTILQAATERGDESLEKLLRQHGAKG